MTKPIMQTVYRGLLSAAAGVFLTLPLSGAAAAAANAPAAIVEDADPGRDTIGLFEMLESGRKIDLNKGERLVLGYLKSCTRETVVGGHVVVGDTESAVSGGKVTREKVECAGGQVALDKSTKGKAGVVVFRKAPKKLPRPGAKSKTLTLGDVSPFLRLTAKTQKVLVQRLDQPGRAKSIRVSGVSVDLRAEGITLAPGGSYEIAAGSRRVRIDIAPDAGVGRSLLGRLVVL